MPDPHGHIQGDVNRPNLLLTSTFEATVPDGAAILAQLRNVSWPMHEFTRDDARARLGPFVTGVGIGSSTINRVEYQFDPRSGGINANKCTLSVIEPHTIDAVRPLFIIGLGIDQAPLVRAQKSVIGFCPIFRLESGNTPNAAESQLVHFESGLSPEERFELLERSIHEPAWFPQVVGNFVDSTLLPRIFERNGALEITGRTCFLMHSFSGALLRTVEAALCSRLKNCGYNDEAITGLFSRIEARVFGFPLVVDCAPGAPPRFATDFYLTPNDLLTPKPHYIMKLIESALLYTNSPVLIGVDPHNPSRRQFVPGYHASAFFIPNMILMNDPAHPFPAVEGSAGSDNVDLVQWSAGAKPPLTNYLGHRIPSYSWVFRYCLGMAEFGHVEQLDLSFAGNIDARAVQRIKHLLAVESDEYRRRGSNAPDLPNFVTGDFSTAG